MRFLAATIAFFITLNCFAECSQDSSKSNYYTGFEAGYSYSFSPNKKRFTDETTNDSAQLGIVFGKNLGCDFRVELEANYKTKASAKSPSGNATSKEQLFDSTLALINIYKSWDYRGSENIQPFLMSGIGVSYNTAGDFKTFDINGSLSNKVLGKKTKDLAYQFGAGVSLKVNEAAYMDFSARYVFRGKADTTGRRIASGVETTQDPEKAVIKDVVALVTVRLHL